MNDLILNKQRNQEAKKSNSLKTVKKRSLVFIKPLLVMMVVTGFIVMSLKNNNLFLKELLVSGGILFLISLVYILSNQDKS